MSWMLFNFTHAVQYYESVQYTRRYSTSYKRAMYTMTALCERAMSVLFMKEWIYFIFIYSAAFITIIFTVYLK